MWYLKHNAAVLARIFLFSSLIANSLLAQPEPSVPTRTAEPSLTRSTLTAATRRQQQAYLRYLAAQRLKGEAERARSQRGQCRGAQRDSFAEACKMFFIGRQVTGAINVYGTDKMRGLGGERFRRRFSVLR